MEKVILKATAREKVSTKELQAQKRSGTIPVELYGHGQKNISLWTGLLAFEKVYAETGTSTIFEVEVDGKKHNVLVQAIELHPLTHRAIHVDLLAVKMNEVVVVQVPLEFVGEAKAVKEMGGMLVRTVEEVEVECLPKDLPQHLEVPLEKLVDFDTHLTVADIVVPAGVTLHVSEEVVVAKADAPRSAEELAALDEKPDGDVTKVEGVVKEGETKEAGDKK